MILNLGQISIYFLLKMNNKTTLHKNTVTDGLKFSTFNYFGLGAILPAVSEAFWINFSAYYFNNLLSHHGNLIFLIAQLVEGVGIIAGWLLLSRNPHSQKLHMHLYIIGTILVIFSLPIVFLPILPGFSVMLLFSCLYKIGSGLAIISQLTIIPKITANRNRRRKLVEKITELGLAGTFIAMVFLTIFSEYVSFVWKYFVGVCSFVILGAICSIAYCYRIRELITQKTQTQKQSNQQDNQIQYPPLIQKRTLKSFKFYLYGVILISTYLYSDIIVTMYPYFIKTFHHISQFKYLSAIVVLYLGAFVSSLVLKNAFVYSGIRTMISLGLSCSILSTAFFIFGFIEIEFGVLIFLGTAFVGISKVIVMNTALNLINQFIGRQVQGKQFIYGLYYFGQKIVSGPILYTLINHVYTEKTLQENLLHFSYIYLPFILYCFSWMLVMVDRTIKQYKNKTARIVIIDPHTNRRQNKVIEEEQENKSQKSTPRKSIRVNIEYEMNQAQNVQGIRLEDFEIKN